LLAFINHGSKRTSTTKLVSVIERGRRNELVIVSAEMKTQLKWILRTVNSTFNVLLVMSSMNARRLAAIVCSVGVGIQAVLFSDYNIPTREPNEKHVFTDIQATYRSYIDRYVFGVKEQQSQSKSNGSPDKSGENR
jgi:hypothetical protein